MAVSSAQKRKSARNPGHRARKRSPRKRPPRKRRWLVLPLALGIAALALCVLVTLGWEGPVASGPPPLDEIDDASRARLERVIREAELREEGAR